MDEHARWSHRVVDGQRVGDVERELMSPDPDAPPPPIEKLADDVVAKDVARQQASGRPSKGSETQSTPAHRSTAGQRSPYEQWERKQFGEPDPDVNYVWWASKQVKVGIGAAAAAVALIVGLAVADVGPFRGPFGGVSRPASSTAATGSATNATIPTNGNGGTDPSAAGLDPCLLGTWEATPENVGTGAGERVSFAV